MWWKEKKRRKKNRKENDICKIDSLKLWLNLSDNAPVKKPPRSISKHLYSEVKHFFEDLLINQWIFKFYSSYACPVVHVRKKDNDKRLCVDYRELNGKIVLNIMPIPKVSDILDHIGGQLYFTTLGITKADHEKLYGDAI